MYRVFVFHVFVVVTLATIEDDKMKKCMKINSSVMRCCTSTKIDPVFLLLPEIKDCYSDPGPDLSCEPEECLAKKVGYYGDDGKINMKNLTLFLEKKFENEQPLMDEFRNNCLDVDTSARAPPMCEFLRMNICLYIEFKNYCTAWSNEGDCQSVKELIDTC